MNPWIDLFGLYILFSQYRSCDDTQEIWSFVLFTKASMNMSACTLFNEQVKGSNRLSIITWSVLGKQNVQAKKVYLIGYIIVFYLLIVNSYASVHIAHHVWTWCNIIKQFFSTCYLTFFLFMPWDYGKFILKQLDYSPSFSTSDSQLACASLTICS